MLGNESKRMRFRVKNKLVSLTSGLSVSQARPSSIITSLLCLLFVSDSLVVNFGARLKALFYDFASAKRNSNYLRFSLAFLSWESSNIGLYVRIFSQWNIRHHARRRDRFNLVWEFNHQILKGRRKIGLWSTATNLNHISRKIADLRF